MPVQFPDRVDPDTGALIARDYFTVNELAAMLRTSPRTVYNKMRDGTWPYTRVVRTPYFTPENVTEILASGQHEAGRPGGLWNEQGRNGAGRE